eukprot:TRINITY_DN1927_c0_g1_i2.p1 TRINITY_DN1927_c0_g1~~TRINITY_DN1927_c0_g1_i2.p1  ORF type:complete len:210 (+),score=44.43 TRINITY_DN1927_c0_g1_i2:84-713(+)
MGDYQREEWSPSQMRRHESALLSQILRMCMQVFQKIDQDRSLSIIKGVGLVRADKEAIFKTLIDLDTRKQWDKFYEGGEIVRWIQPERECISRMRSKTYSYMVWPRDACLHVAAKKTAGSVPLEDEYLVTAFSTIDDQCPEVQGFVRGEVIVSGFQVKSVAEGVAQITYIFEVDAKGWIPATLVDLVNNAQPLCIIGIRKLLTGSTQHE